MELILLDIFEKAPFLIAILAGILTFLSPCILPLILPYMSYIGGLSVEEIKSGNIRTKIVIFRRSLAFVSGFSSVFIIFGVSLNNIIGVILSNTIINYISAIIIIMFGIHFLGIFRISHLYKTKAINLDKIIMNNKLKLITPFILGVGFALGWSPCVGPILSSIMILSSKSIDGLYLMMAYALGLSMPFLLTAIATEKLLTMFDGIKKYYAVIQVISGLLLIIIGLIIALGGLDKLTAML